MKVNVAPVWFVGFVGFAGPLLIVGAGGLAVHRPRRADAVADARDMGADRIIVFDRIPGRLDLARACSADHALSIDELPTPKKRIAAVKDLTEGFGVAMANYSLWALGQGARVPQAHARSPPVRVAPVARVPARADLGRVQPGRVAAQRPRSVAGVARGDLDGLTSRLTPEAPGYTRPKS